jgi:ribonuclease H / adenosylcobalamin/alpha-ribazole phosphatase
VTRRLRVVVEADGGARGNPGPAGYGAVVREANTGEVLAERSAALGVNTNNVAEYSGLIAGLQAAADLGATAVEVRMDSKLVVEQMSGRWQIKHPGLRPLAAQAAALIRRFDAVTLEWIPRERNKHADALANAAMDAAAGIAPRGAARPAGGAARPAGGGAGPARPKGEGATPRPTWEPPTDSATNRATRLILVRHGETTLTAERRYSGRGDVPLSERGVAQAAAVARRVSTLVGSGSVAAVVTSPLSRCARTAKVIAEAAGSPPVAVEPDLVECDFGEWEGLTFAEVGERWPRELDAWLGSTSVAPPGGESFVDVDARVRRAVLKLREQHAGSTVVVVSHVSPLKVLLRDALGATDAFLHRMLLDPGGISIVDSWPDRGVAVRTVNDTAHL